MLSNAGEASLKNGVAQVECVTLSDSVPSLPKCTSTQPNSYAVAKGNSKVVCLDSDTDSDGSYTQLGINGFACRAAEDFALSSVVEVGRNDAHEKETRNWLGLQNCTSKRESLSTTLLPDCEKKNVPLSGPLSDYVASDQGAGAFLGDLELKPDFGAEGGHDVNDDLQKSSSRYLSLCCEDKNKRGVECKSLDKGKSVFSVVSMYGNADAGGSKLVSIESDDCSTGLIDQGQTFDAYNANVSCNKRKSFENTSDLAHTDQDGDSGDYSFSTRNSPTSGMYIAEPIDSEDSDKKLGSPSLTLLCDKKSVLLLGYKESSNQDDCSHVSTSDSGADAGPKRKHDESQPHNASGDGVCCTSSLCAEDQLSLESEPLDKITISRNPNAGSSLVSIEWDEYPAIPSWNDHLKDLIHKIQSSKATDAYIGGRGVKADFRDQDRDSGGNSSSKRKSPDTGRYSGRSAELSDDEDSVTCKRQNQNNKGRQMKTGKSGCDPDKAFEREAEKQRKMNERIKKRQEDEAKKKQKQEERVRIQQQKQDEKKRQQEERKKRKEEEKIRKEELKAEAMERRKAEREKEKWEKGKFALQNITALVDTRVLEGGLIGGHLLTRLAEKGFKYRLILNPVKRTVVWQMRLPSKDLQADSQLCDSHRVEASSDGLESELLVKNIDVSYILVVLEAEEFLDMIVKGDLDRHIGNIQKQYPGFTICYLINKLLWYLHKREQQQYKNPGENKWIRPPVEQVLAKLITSYDRVHSRLCQDEAEVADHIVGLTRSLAECPFKCKLSSLSLSANGDHVMRHDPNSDIIKKDVWLKALVAIPKVSGSAALAIARKYPSMSSLFKAYLDTSKTVYEKEHLLQDLMKEGLLGGESRRVGPACSRRIYRILMAQQGNLVTDDVEEGADLFRG